jgi:hypothetical protein
MDERFTARMDEPFVVFMVGMRINKLLRRQQVVADDARDGPNAP